MPTDMNAVLIRKSGFGFICEQPETGDYLSDLLGQVNSKARVMRRGQSSERGRAGEPPIRAGRGRIVCPLADLIYIPVIATR
jgi:hypothetical protein